MASVCGVRGRVLPAGPHPMVDAGRLAFMERVFETEGMASGRRKPDPDRILCAMLPGTAKRLARAGLASRDVVFEFSAGRRGVVM